MGVDRDRGLSYDAHGFEHLRSCTQHCDWGCHQEECRYLHIATPPPAPGFLREKSLRTYVTFRAQDSPRFPANTIGDLVEGASGLERYYSSGA